MEKKEIKGHVSILVAELFWGLCAPVSKAALNGGIDPMALTAFRMVGAAVCFWLVSLFTKHEHVNHHDLLLLFFASLFAIVFNQGTFMFGLSLTSPIDASVVTTMLPLVTMVVAAIYLKEPVTSKKIMGVFVGAIGALLLVLGSTNNSGRSSNVCGDLLCLVSQFSFAIYLTVFRDLIRRYSGVTIMKWMFIYAALCYLPFSYGSLTSIDYASVSFDTYMECVYIVLFGTFVSYLCVMPAQQTLRPTVVSMYNYVQPVVASSVAVVMCMDTFGVSKAVAAVLVFSGVYLVTQSKSRAQMEEYERKKSDDNREIEA